MSIFDKPINTGNTGVSSTNSANSGGSIFSNSITTPNYNPNPTVTKTTEKKPTQTSSPSPISSAPQIISGIAKGINIGKLIVTAATRQPTQPQIDVSKVVLPTPQPQATPQKTISITPNQKILTPQQLKVVALQPVAGQSATMKAAKPGTPGIGERYSSFISKTYPQSIAGVDQIVKDPAGTKGAPLDFKPSKKSLIDDPIRQYSGAVNNALNVIVTTFQNIDKEAMRNYAEGQKIQKTGVVPKDYATTNLTGLIKQTKNVLTGVALPGTVPFAAAEAMPVINTAARAVGVVFSAIGESGKTVLTPILDKLGVKGELRDNVLELGALIAQFAVGHKLNSISKEAIKTIDIVGKDAFTKMTKDVIETNGGKGTVSFTPADVVKSVQGSTEKPYFAELRKIVNETTNAATEKVGIDPKTGNFAAPSGGAGGDLWTKAVKEGITIELPFEKVIGMVDKPWWGKIKKFLNAGVTDTTTTTQVPGRIVGPATEGAAPAVSIEKKITALLPENINHNPQAVINAVIKGGLDTTPEGKGLIKAALEAQQAGTDLTISTADTQAAVKAINHEIRLHAEDPKGLHLDNGNTYVHLTPEQSVALSPELQKIPESQSLIHISSLSSLVDNPKYTPVTSLAELAASNPDVKTALVNAGIDPLTGRVNRAMLVAEQAKQMAQTVADEVKKYEAQAAVDKNIAAKEAQQTKVIDQVSTPPEDALRQEALKYKSAEEFVRAFNKRTSKIEFGDDTADIRRGIKSEDIELNRQFIEAAQAPEYQKMYQVGKNDTNVLTDIWNKANEPTGKAPETPQAVTKPVVKKPAEPLAPQDMEAAKARIEARSAASAEMDKIPINTDAQTPVGTGELKKSKAYTRVFDLLKEEFQQDVSYNVLNLEKDAKNAVDYIAKDPKSAIRIGLGLEQPPEGQTETAISIALAEKAATEGDYALQSRLESSRSLRQTRRGQEIVSERGRFEADSPHKYMRELLNKRLSNLGANVKDALAETVNRATNVKQAAMDKIDSEAKKIKEAIKKDRKKIQMAQDIINSLICK